MDKDDIHLTDIYRILLGEAPPEFLIETAIRILFLYILLMVSMRLMGKRMSARLSRSEMAAMVSLAATIGIPMQTPDRGLLPAFVVAGVFIVFVRLVARLTSRNKNLEHLALDDIEIIVQDGCLQMNGIRQNAISKSLVFATLRSREIDNLGKVERLYLESNGAFTLKTFPDKRTGLSLFPEWDVEMLNRQQHSDKLVCKECGNLHPPQSTLADCPNCYNSSWIAAVES